jgi:hypothetical protein
VSIDQPVDVKFYDSDGKPGIRLINGRLPEILDALADVISINKDQNIYRHAGRLVRVYEVNSEPNGINRPEGAILIHPIDVSHFTELAGLVAKFVKFDMRVTDPETGKKGAWVKCDCPRRIAEAYLSRGHFPEVLMLNGFSEAPTIIGMTVVDKPGYDEMSGLYLAFSMGDLPGYDYVLDFPSKKDAAQSLEILDEAISGFPYVNGADKSAIISAILTALIRRTLPAAPMFGITAPMPGTGKTLLADTISIIATGRRASVISLGHDDAETEKRVGGALLAGDAVLPLDNIERALGGDLLCQITTQPSVRIRPLGISKVVSLPTNSLLLATGNNLSITGDLKRRVVLIRLDAKTERPEQRPIPRNHLDYILSIRGKIIKAALTIIKAYLLKGSPVTKGHIPFGSFDDWDRLVRRPLLWLEYPDPLQSAEALRDSDPDIETMRALFHAWLDINELKRPCTVAEIIKVGNDYLMGGEPSYPDMRDALQLVCAEKINGRRLGYWLRAHKDRIVDGIQLQRVGEDGHSKVATWKVVKCG